MGGNGTYKGVHYSKWLVVVWTGCNWFSAGFLFSRMKRQLDHCCLDFHATRPKSSCNQWLVWSSCCLFCSFELDLESLVNALNVAGVSQYDDMGSCPMSSGNKVPWMRLKASGPSVNCVIYLNVLIWEDSAGGCSEGLMLLSSVWKSSPRTGKRLQPNWTKTKKDHLLVFCSLGLGLFILEKSKGPKKTCLNWSFLGQIMYILTTILGLFLVILSYFFGIYLCRFSLTREYLTCHPEMWISLSFLGQIT